LQLLQIEELYYDLYNLIKRDCYDLDFLYLKKHPEFEGYEIYEG
jgi:hypothetical protein